MPIPTSRGWWMFQNTSTRARKSGMAGICAQGSMFSSSAPTMLAVMKTRLAGSSRYSGRVSIGPSSPVRAAGGPSRDQLLRDFGQGRAVEQEHQHEAAALDRGGRLDHRAREGVRRGRAELHHAAHRQARGEEVVEPRGLEQVALAQV